MIRILAAALTLVAISDARAQTVAPGPQAQLQKGIGLTGTMYDGNNLARFPLAPPPAANPTNPAAGTTGVTGAQGSRDESGAGAGGGEH